MLLFEVVDVHEVVGMDAVEGVDLVERHKNIQILILEVDEVGEGVTIWLQTSRTFCKLFGKNG